MGILKDFAGRNLAEVKSDPKLPLAEAVRHVAASAIVAEENGVTPYEWAMACLTIGMRIYFEDRQMTGLQSTLIQIGQVLADRYPQNLRLLDS